jgi:hypothetical protein
MSDQGISEIRRRSASGATAMERKRLKGMKIAMQECLGITGAILEGWEENIFRRNSQEPVLNP